MGKNLYELPLVSKTLMYSKPLIVGVLSVLFVVLVYSPTSVFDLNATTPKFGRDFNAPQTGQDTEDEISAQIQK
jgi:hypothetical protein